MTDALKTTETMDDCCEQLPHAGTPPWSRNAVPETNAAVSRRNMPAIISRANGRVWSDSLSVRGGERRRHHTGTAATYTTSIVSIDSSWPSEWSGKHVLVRRSSDAHRSRHHAAPIAALERAVIGSPEGGLSSDFGFRLGRKVAGGSSTDTER